MFPDFTTTYKKKIKFNIVAFEIPFFYIYIMAKLDITSTALEKSVELVKGFIEKLTGSAFEEIGLMWSDNIKMKRFQNQIKILTKAQKIIEESGINTKQISLKTLVPLLEYSSLEEEETLQEKWSNLIVNFADASVKYESSIYPYILNQLSSEEITVLDGMYEKRKTLYNYNEISNNLIRNNLVRLGLADSMLPSEFKASYHSNGDKTDLLILTELGVKFIECCRKK